MEIIKTPLNNLSQTQGRPIKYPFRQLKPGHSIVCDYSDTDLQRIRSAFYQFRKYNKLNWKCSIRVDQGQIFVNRLS